MLGGNRFIVEYFKAIFDHSVIDITLKVECIVFRYCRIGILNILYF